MGILQHIFQRRDLGVIDSLLSAGICATGVFMWVEAGTTFDNDTELHNSWQWQLWQIGSVVLAVVGVWWLWRNTSKAPWVRTVCLVSLSVAVLLNAYTDLFNASNNLWFTINPLHIACASVVTVNCWGRIMAQRQDMETANPLTYTAAATALGIGCAVIINGYFVGHEPTWDIVNPLMVIFGLAWASAARRSNIGDAI